MAEVRLAIVGSTRFAHDERGVVWAARLMHDYIQRLSPIQIISGGAEGIDSLAAATARVNGIHLDEVLPKHHRWAPDGYKDRNIIVAQRCTHLVCIRHHLSTTYGSGWTADFAEGMGKPVDRYLWEGASGSVSIAGIRA